MLFYFVISMPCLVGFGLVWGLLRWVSFGIGSSLSWGVLVSVKKCLSIGLDWLIVLRMFGIAGCWIIVVFVDLFLILFIVGVGGSAMKFIGFSVRKKRSISKSMLFFV